MSPINLLLLGLFLPTVVSAQENNEKLLTTDYANISLNYCVDPDWYPYESIKEEQHIGISSELVKLLTSKTGIHVKLVITNSWSETIELLKNGQCDFTPMLNQSENRDQYLMFSEVWYRSPNVLISLKDEPFLQGMENIGTRSVALTKGYRITDYVKEHYPNLNTMIVANENSGIQALVNNEADVFIGSILSINNYIQTKGYEEVKIAGWAGPEDMLRVGVTHKNQALLPIFNQVIAQISETDRIKMYRNWNNVSYIDNTNYKLIKTLIVVFVLSVMAGLIYGFIVRKLPKKLILHNNELSLLKTKLTQSNNELLFLTHHDLLTQIYNRHYFNQVINDKTKKYNSKRPICLIFFDVDHFKSINDHHGHTVGDQVLKSIAQAINASLTEQHIFVRWGGEEFIILCQQTNEPKAYELCNKINQILNQIDLQLVDKVTCSFGIAQLQDDELISQCIERADQAMYQAKSNGRNQIISA